MHTHSRERRFPRRPGAARLTAEQRSAVEQHLPLVHVLARQQRRRFSVELDELVSSGALGLVRAAQRFDRSRGVPFGAYARHRILGSMLDTARKELTTRGTVVTVADMDELPSQEQPQPEESALVSEHIVTLRQLDPRTRHVLIERLHGKSQRAIGAELGLSEARVSQISGQAKQALEQDAPAEQPTEPASDLLTPAQVDALCGAAQGETTKETAGRLGKSVWTVRSQKKEALRRLGARSITHAVVRALLDGAVSLEDLSERWAEADGAAGQPPLQ